MFQLNEKSFADNRTLISIQKSKRDINTILKNGTLNYVSQDNSLWLTTPKIRQAYINRQDNVYDLFDKVILAKNGTTVSELLEFSSTINFLDNLNVKKNLVIDGNLLVKGTTTTINASSLSVEKNIIELNENEPGDGISAGISGFAINRGERGFSRFLYNENKKGFFVDISSDKNSQNSTDWIFYAYAENVDDRVAGEFEIKHKLRTPNLLSTNSTLENANISNLNITREITCDGNFTANSASIFNGGFTANSKANFTNNVIFSKLTTFKEDIIINRNLEVKNVSTFNNTLNIANNGLNVTGNTALNNNLSVRGATVLNNNLDVLGATNVTTLNTSRLLTTNDINVENNMMINNTSTFQGTSIFNDVVTINNDLNVTTGNINIDSIVNINNQTAINGNSLFVNKRDNLGGNLFVDNNVTINNDLLVKRNSMIQGDCIVSGLNSSESNLSNSYKLRVGNGKGLSFFDSTDYSIYMSETQDSSFGGNVLNASESDYNMYFSMENNSNGINRGFVFKNGLDALLQIEGNGNIRAKNKLYSNGYKVLSEEDYGHGKNINADMIDGIEGDFLVCKDEIDTKGKFKIIFNEEENSIDFLSIEE